MISQEALREAEESIERLAVRAYELHNRKFTPCYPWNFCRVLSKEQVQNGIILPAIEQNKTIHEGVILATWKPFTNSKGVSKVSEFQVGDHVLFQHWAGTPIAGFSSKHYRVIRGEDWKENEQGGIFAKVEYDAIKPSQKLSSMLQTYVTKGLVPFGVSPEYVKVDDLAEKIEQQFLLVDRESQSVTLSGR